MDEEIHSHIVPRPLRLHICLMPLTTYCRHIQAFIDAKGSPKTYPFTYITTVLPRIMARVFISFQWFLTRSLNETDVYYWKKHVLFIICDASDEKLMTHEALYYAFYYVITCYNQATNWDPTFIWDWPYFEAIRYTYKYTIPLTLYILQYELSNCGFWLFIIVLE